MDDKKNALGLKIKQLREGRGWSQEHLAKEAKIARTVITMIETGQRYPSENTLNKIINALGITRNDIDTPEVREQAKQQFKEASESFANNASTDEIIKIYRKMMKDD